MTQSQTEITSEPPEPTRKHRGRVGCVILALLILLPLCVCSTSTWNDIYQFFVARYQNIESNFPIFPGSEQLARMNGLVDASHDMVVVAYWTPAEADALYGWFEAQNNPHILLSRPIEYPAGTLLYQHIETWLECTEAMLRCINVTLIRVPSDQGVRVPAIVDYPFLSQSVATSQTFPDKQGGTLILYSYRIWVP